MNTHDHIQPTPTWRGSLSHGWETMKKYFLPLFLIIIVLSIVDAPLETFQRLSREEDRDFSIWVEFMAAAYWLLFVPPIKFSADLLFVQSVRNTRIKVKDIIIGFNNFINIVLTNLLVIALVGIALIALIIPGIIVGCRLAFVSYLVMDKNYDPITAVETSWKMTRGYGWTIFGLGFTSIFIFIGGLVLAIVGAIPAVIWVKSSFASLYQAVHDEVGDDFFDQITLNQSA